MSWLSDLAGKAENILNKLDTEAASVLTKQRRKSGTSQQVTSEPCYAVSSSSDHRRSSSCGFPSSVSVPVNLSAFGDSSTTQDGKQDSRGTESLTPSPKRNKIKKGSKRQSEQEFIDFLNNDQNVSDVGNTLSVAEGNANVNIPKSDLAHSRQSSVSSGSSFLAVSGRDTPGFASLDVESSTGSGSTDPYVTLENPSDVMLSAPSSRSSNDSDGGNGKTSEKMVKKSTTEMQSSYSSQECAMLRKEVSSLNQEMIQVLKRAKESEKESQRLRDQYSTLSLQQRQSDTLLRDMQGREAKLQVSHRSKENFISSLQSKLLDSDHRIQEREKTIKELQQQNQRLLEGASMNNSLHSEAVTSLQEKVKDMEASLQREREIHLHSTDELNQRVSQLEEDQKAMMKDLSDANKKLQDERLNTASLHTQISVLKNEASDAREELTDYKAKAGRILQSKDKLISSLKEGHVVGGNQEELLSEEMEQLRGERDLLQEEYNRSSMRIKQLTVEVAETEVIAQQDAKSAIHHVSQLEEDLTREQTERGLVQEELRQSKQELKCVQEELTRQKVNLSSRLQERDDEIQRLQKQIAHKQSSSSGVTELENRIHGLTESLIVKQTTIESLSTDKHTLLLQLEALQEQYQESQKLLNKDLVIDFSQDEVRNRGVPSFLMESPFDGGVTRRVKKAYGTLDKFSVRLGVFLRRYPIARVFVLLYMGLLHAWVMIVLLTYKPEIHGTDFIHPYPVGGGGSAPKLPLGE